MLKEKVLKIGFIPFVMLKEKVLKIGFIPFIIKIIKILVRCTSFWSVRWYSKILISSEEMQIALGQFMQKERKRVVLKVCQTVFFIKDA